MTEIPLYMVEHHECDVTARSVKRQNNLSDQAKGAMIQKVVAGGESSLALLLGTPTFINWFVTILLPRLKYCDFNLLTGSICSP